MSTPHKHAAAIHAWADGAVVESRSNANPGWDEDSFPSWATHCEYRIKPEMLRYRVALFNSGVGNSFIVASSEVSEFALEERNANFVRWLGDWQEVEA